MIPTFIISPAIEDEAKQHDLIPKSSVSPSAVACFNAEETETLSASEKQSTNLVTGSESFTVRSFSFFVLSI